MRLYYYQLRTQAFSHLNGLRRMHTEPPCLVTGCRYDTTFGIVSYSYRLATKLRIFSLLYSREKLIHVHVDDLHMPFFSLFRFDVNLGYASVLHALELAEGSGATEAVAARGDAVVIEEV